MVTPMAADGSVDIDAGVALARHLVDHGHDGLVLNGTTGEAPTTHAPEKAELVRAVVAVVHQMASQRDTGIDVDRAVRSHRGDHGSQEVAERPGRGGHGGQPTAARPGPAPPFRPSTGAATGTGSALLRATCTTLRPGPGRRR